MNKGHLAILQKRRFIDNLEDIQTRDERLRVLKECNAQLVHAWSLLDTFHSLDERISELRTLVDDTYIFYPDLGCAVKKHVLIPNE